ncbi:MAG: DUF1559 domain-containing protein [Planctomycetota bacterium]
MSATKPLRGMTLTGVVVSLTITSALMAMVLAALSGVRDKANEAACLNNLRQIATALEAYHQAYDAYPPDYPQGLWTMDLLPFLSSPQVLHCPADKIPGRNSYEPFYVLRREDDQLKFVLGCPRHEKSGLSSILFADRSMGQLKVEPVLWQAQGSPKKVDLPLGEGVKGGKLFFADGSEVTASNALGIMALQSFRLSDGRLYSVVRVLDGETGPVQVKVHKGSLFDVVTPGVVAGAEGTRFSVASGLVATEPASFVSCTEGRIYVATADQKLRHLVAGNSGMMRTGLTRYLIHSHWHAHRLRPSDPTCDEFIWHCHPHAVKDHHPPYVDYGPHQVTDEWRYLGGFPAY